MIVKVFTVERCYDYEGCSLERVFGTLVEAETYAEAQKREGTSADMNITEWEVATPVSEGTGDG